MAVFKVEFIVPAALAQVADFHHETLALKRLTPPPVFVQLQRVEPLAEGSISEFTMWFGPFPVRWVARHSKVDRLHGFTDSQVKGPMQFWQHTHRFEAVDENTTRIIERVEYLFRPGWQGWWTHILFSALALRFMFAYRAWVTRRLLKSKTA
jgi:ligand-binding SRPBCC domain-containing protein